MNDLEQFLQAEFAATQQLLIRSISNLAVLVKHAGMNQDDFLSMQLEAGLRELDQAVFHGASEAAAETAKERAKARYMTLIAAAGTPRSC